MNIKKNARYNHALEIQIHKIHGKVKFPKIGLRPNPQFKSKKADPPPPFGKKNSASVIDNIYVLPCFSSVLNTANASNHSQYFKVGVSKKKYWHTNW